MSVERFSPLNIYKAQYKATRKYSESENSKPRRSVVSVVVIYGLPIAAGLLSFLTNAKLAFADSLLSTLGILAGALIAAFTQLAAWRQTLSDTNAPTGESHRPERWLADSSVANILAGAYSCILACVAIIVGLVVELPTQIHCLNTTIIIWPRLHSLGTALIFSLSAHVAVSMLLSLPGMYAAYADINEVSRWLNGQVSKDYKPII